MVEGRDGGGKVTITCYVSLLFRNMLRNQRNLLNTIMETGVMRHLGAYYRMYYR